LLKARRRMTSEPHSWRNKPIVKLAASYPDGPAANPSAKNLIQIEIKAIIFKLSDALQLSFQRFSLKRNSFGLEKTKYRKVNASCSTTIMGVNGLDFSG